MNKNPIFVYRIIISGFRYLLLFVFVSSIIYGCKNDASLLGLDIIPPSDNLFVKFDTSMTFNSFTIFEDSVKSDEGSLNAATSYNLLGSYYDPVFGFSKADFITQILLSSNNVDLGDDLIIDSIVLNLKVKDSYGLDKNMQQTIKVYRLTDSINIDSNYYSNLNIDAYYNSSEVLGQSDFSPANGSIISVHLNPELLQNLYDPTVLVDNTSLLKSFFGLYVTTEPVNSYGTIYYIDILSSESVLTMYYRNDSVNGWIHSGLGRKSYDFVFSSNCARVNLFRHDYSSAQYQFTYNDSLYHDSLVYIQAMGGMKGKFMYNNLAGWADSIRYDSIKNENQNIAINKAEIVFSILQDTRTPQKYDAPLRLTLLAVNKDGTYESLSDQSVSTSYFDGYYNSSSQIYKFNVSLHLQQLINGEKEDFDYYYIYPSDNRSSANRVILKNSPANRIQLQVTYIKY